MTVLDMQSLSGTAKLPVSFLMAASVAAQGVYRRQNIMNEIADSGVNIWLITPLTELTPGAEAMTDSVLTVASLAVSPAMTEAAAPGLPKPSGANTGAMMLPRRHRMLSSKSEVMCRPVSKFCRYHMMTEAMNITVKAFFTNPPVFASTDNVTERIL